MKDLINPNLDLKKIHSSFKEKGYVVIDNYLKDEVAENLNNFFSYENANRLVVNRYVPIKRY